MTQVGEAVAVEVDSDANPKFVLLAIVEVTFDSGIEIYELDGAGDATLLPPSGTPHWSRAKGSHPAVYVREGGKGETKKVKVKVGWIQQGCDGSVKLEGKSADVCISGDFSISGEH